MAEQTGRIQITEKVSVNMNLATLARIDMLVEAGHYSSRSDFINEATRRVLDEKRETLAQIEQTQRASMQRVTDAENEGSHWFIGFCGLEREELEALKAQGKTIRVVGYGLLDVSRNIPDDLVKATVTSFRIHGKIRCSDELKRYYCL